MTVHDDILGALLGVLEPMKGEIRLLGRIADPLTGNTTDDAFVFVPDLHLISSQRQASYGSYGFNYAASGLLHQLLTSLLGLKKSWDDAGTRDLVTVQIGDFFDLWRELGPLQTIASIADDTHGDLRDILYRGALRGEPCLEAVMLLGNHDTHGGSPLPEIPLMLKAFNRPAKPSDKPFLFMTHGDAFDVLELNVPEFAKAFVVNVAGTLTPITTYSITDWGKVSAKTNKPLAELQNAITQPDHPLPIQGAVKVTPGIALPDRVAQSVTPTETSRRFNCYYQAFTLPAVAASDSSDVRIVVAGHTHDAGMLVCTPTGQKPLVLMDIGAWIERCTYPLAEGGVVSEPSAQLGVIHGNDARIYQIRIPA
jgi:hypothetical protein